MRLPFPRKIDLYILGEVISPFLGGILFFSFIFLMFQALRLADFFIIHGVSGSLLIKLTALMALSFMPTALPVAFLIGALVAFGRLSADSELVAMKANGFSIWRLAAPVVVVSLLVVGISLGLNMDWVPAGNRAFKQTLIKVSSTKVVSSIKEGTFTTGFFDLLVFADHIDASTNRMYRVFIYDEREPKNPLTVVAQEGELLPVRPDTPFGSAVILKLYRGNIHRNDNETSTYQKIDFKEYRLFLKIDEGTETAMVKPRMLSHQVLDETLAKDPGNTELRIELWRRYATAMTPLIFAFMGVGFGTVRTRAVRAGAALIALGVILAYWGIQAGAGVAAQKGWISPFLAMQIPNLIMAGLAALGLRSASW